MFWEPNTFCGPCQCVGFVKQTKKNQCMIFTAESKQAQGEETPVFSSSQTKKKKTFCHKYIQAAVSYLPVYSV